MDTQFKVSFDQSHSNLSNEQRKYDLQVEHYVESEEELFYLFEEKILEFTEYKSLRLRFKSDSRDAKVYFDLFDGIPRDVLNDDSNGLYLASNEEDLTLFENNNDYLVAVPGYYKLSVRYNERWFYTLIKVASSRISEQQMFFMKEDIEAKVRGLAKDIIQKNLQKEKIGNGTVDLDILNRLELLKTTLYKWTRVINEFEKNLKYKIKREYQKTHLSKITFVDSVVIRNIAMSKNKNNVKAAKNIISYDLPENRFLKRTMRLILKESNVLMQQINQMNLSIGSEIIELSKYKSQRNGLMIGQIRKVKDDLTYYQKMLRKIMSEVYSVLELEVMKEINDSGFVYGFISNTTSTLYKDVQEFYKLFNTQSSIILSMKYEYAWKRTDKLYEIWGMLKFVDLIKSLGFENITNESGFLERSNSFEYKVPYLGQNTKFIFTDGFITLALVYDTEIPFQKVDISICPLHTENTTHNRPDLRLDIYHKADYFGSVLIDFKYRPVRNIWSSKANNKVEDTNSKKQLLGYKNSISSKYVFKKDKFSDDRAVKYVWAIYPDYDMNTQKLDTDDERIQLITLTPMRGNEELSSHLEDCLTHFKELIIHQVHS